MKILNGQLRLAATDVSNHLACRHLTRLELAVARGMVPAPEGAAPDLKVIQEVGKRHEAAYLDHLQQAKGLKVVRLPEHGPEGALVRETLRSMAEGAGANGQGALGDGRWYGRPDVLLRVDRPSQKWRWSYEVQDTKLARETKAGTILQLSVYSELLGLAQGGNPESMWVVTPNAGFTSERYRVAEYAAYFRYVKRGMLQATNGCEASPAQGNLFEIGASGGSALEPYPEPVEHCNVCRWFKECDARRRADDHLSLVAGIRTQQRQQLQDWSVLTLAQLAEMPLPLKQKPRYG